jgi:AhpD family alkylhydroperoxidase
MPSLKITNKLDAKPDSAPLLEMVEQKYGFIPNLMSVFADSPSTLQAYLTLSELVGKSAFTPEEQQAILISASIENECEYCVAAHSMVATKMTGMSSENLNAIRNGKTIENKKMNELVKFTRLIVSKRGFVDGVSVSNFIEVILGVTMKTLSNYTNHLAETPLDPAFLDFSWSK